MTTTIKVDDKYTVQHEHGTNLRTLRYGQPWREHVGDKLILAMAQRIEQLEALVTRNNKDETNATVSVAGLSH